jgi:hypothetical protein
MTENTGILGPPSSTNYTVFYIIKHRHYLDAVSYSLARHEKRHSYRLSYLYKPATKSSTGNHMKAAITVITLDPSFPITLGMVTVGFQHGDWVCITGKNEQKRNMSSICFRDTSLFPRNTPD